MADELVGFLVWGLEVGRCGRGSLPERVRGGCGLRAKATAARMWRKAGALGLVTLHRRVAAGPNRMWWAGPAGRGPAFGFGVRGKIRPHNVPERQTLNNTRPEAGD